MDTFVSDSSVLIDIQRSSLADKLFRLPYNFVVPNMLYAIELRQWIGPELKRLGLTAIDLTDNELEQATQLKRQTVALSVADAFALTLADSRGWKLLTGDRAMRAEAEAKNVAVHGVLWIFDKLEQHNICKKKDLKVGLTALSEHPRCRLPDREIKLRLKRYM